MSKKESSINFIYSLVGIATLGTVPLEVSAQNQQQEDKGPNFLFILADDLGYKDLGCYGSSFHETPNLDELASQGVKFTNAYAACPVSSPTRSSIMTGKYPARTNNTDWLGAPQPDNVENHWTRNKTLLPAEYREYMELDETTLAEAFKNNGYSTFFAGKWHLGPSEKYWPTKQGFDVNKGGYSAGSPNTSGEANGYFSPYGNPELEDGPKGEHLPNRLAEETVDFIDNHKDERFLAYLSFYSVHNPQMARDDLKKKYQRKKDSLGLEVKWGKEGSRKERLVQCSPVYAGMVEALDLAVGKVMDKLEASGLDENTIIIFMSDNGGLSTSEGHPTTNVPLRAGKGWLYEGGIREPMIIKWPGVTESNTVCDFPVTSTDFYPTMLEMAGLPLKPEQHKDGVSLVNLLKKDKKPDRKAIYWHYPHYGNQGGSPGSAIRWGRYKLIKFYENDRVELYDLSVDLREKHDISDDKPELTQKLLQKLNTWLDKTNARYPSPNPAHE